MSPQLKANRQIIINRINKIQEDLSFFYNHPTEEKKGRAWQLTFDHFFSKKTGKPTKSWKRKTQELIDLIGLPLYQKYTTGFLRKLYDLVRLIQQTKTGNELYFLHEQFQELFKGMIWAAPFVNDDTLTRLVENIGLTCFKKIPTHGAISIKLGNACIYSLANLPDRGGIEQLLHFRNKITYPSVRRNVEKHLQLIAQKYEMTTDQLEEMAVSDFKLSADYEIVASLATYRGVIAIEEDGKVVTSWFDGKDKRLKNAPKSLDAVAVKDFKNEAKKLKNYLSVQRQRIEDVFLRRRLWRYEVWEKYYHLHPLVSHLTRRLIWQFTRDDKSVAAIFFGEYWQTVDGVKLDWIDAQTTVKLWHPFHATAPTVLQWRTWLEKHQIRQPFKQAYREIYLLTDAERNTENYSNRFAAHILRQHQFAALCKIRNWQYKLKGQWANDSIPTITIPAWDMIAEFWVEIDWEGEATEKGAFQLIFTDQVRFYKDDEQLEMDDVPAIVFSEIMRDVDLFVGVTSIGNDPGWQDNNTEHNDYWRNYSFSELSASAKVRKTALEKLIPRLKIASKCHFEDRFLIVKGSRRTYKIHLGSGNILMEPNDQYLCIVPNRKDQKLDKLFLPFEGDQLLSIIVSKALLLAADQQIKDPVILAQLLD